MKFSYPYAYIQMYRSPIAEWIVQSAKQSCNDQKAADRLLGGVVEYNFVIGLLTSLRNSKKVASSAEKSLLNHAGEIASLAEVG